MRQVTENKHENWSDPPPMKIKRAALVFGYGFE